MIYLHHPKHGVKIASLEMEAQYDETNGWTRFDPAELNAIISPPDEPLLETAEQANLLAEPRRRGRPRIAKSE